MDPRYVKLPTARDWRTKVKSLRILVEPGLLRSPHSHRNCGHRNYGSEFPAPLAAGAGHGTVFAMAENSPGWYPDPENPLRERLWDGSDWVDRVRPRPPAAATPTVGATTAQKPLRPPSPVGGRSSLAIASVLAASLSLFITTLYSPDTKFTCLDFDTTSRLYGCGTSVDALWMDDVGMGFLLAMLGSILAVALGHGALYQLKRKDTLRGKRLAQIGTALGWGTLVLYLLVVAD